MASVLAWRRLVLDPLFDRRFELFNRSVGCHRVRVWYIRMDCYGITRLQPDRVQDLSAKVTELGAHFADVDVVQVVAAAAGIAHGHAASASAASTAVSSTACL